MIITIVRSFKLDLVVVLLGGLVGLPFSSESFNHSFGLRGLGRVRVGVDEVDDLRVVSWCRRDSCPSHELVGGLWAKFGLIRARLDLDSVRTASKSKKKPPSASLMETTRVDGVRSAGSDSLLQLELRVADLHRVLGDGLAVLAAGVAPADVLVGRLVHVPVCIMHDIASREREMTGRRASLLDVVERAARCSRSRVRMLPHGTGSGLDLAR